MEKSYMKVEKLRINVRIVGEGLAKAERTVFGGSLQSGERSWQSCSQMKSWNSLLNAFFVMTLARKVC